jgi:hypothetical protein
MENRSGQSQDDEIDPGVVVLGIALYRLRGMWLDTLAMVEPINASALFLGPPRPAFTVLLGMVGAAPSHHQHLHIRPFTDGRGDRNRRSSYVVQSRTVKKQRQSRLSVRALLKTFP